MTEVLLVVQLCYHPDALRCYRLPDEPGYVSCNPREPGDYCGGCDMCLGMQDAHYSRLDRERF